MINVVRWEEPGWGGHLPAEREVSREAGGRAGRKWGLLRDWGGRRRWLEPGGAAAGRGQEAEDVLT